MGLSLAFCMKYRGAYLVPLKNKNRIQPLVNPALTDGGP